MLVADAVAEVVGAVFGRALERHLKHGGLESVARVLHVFADAELAADPFVALRA